MKIFITLLSFLFSISALAGPAQVNSVVNLGGPQNGALNSMVIPIGSLASHYTVLSAGTITNSNYYAFTKMGTGGGAWQITAGKVAYCTGFWYNAANAGNLVALGYGDTAVTTANAGTASAPTNPVHLYNDSTNIVSGIGMGSTTGDNVWYPFSSYFPATKYPFVRINGTNTNSFHMVMDCYEP
jgi:hypothetical protein